MSNYHRLYAARYSSYFSHAVGLCWTLGCRYPSTGVYAARRCDTSRRRVSFNPYTCFQGILYFAPPSIVSSLKNDMALIDRCSMHYDKIAAAIPLLVTLALRLVRLKCCSRVRSTCSNKCFSRRRHPCRESVFDGYNGVSSTPRRLLHSIEEQLQASSTICIAVVAISEIQSNVTSQVARTESLLLHSLGYLDRFSCIAYT